MAKKIYVGVSDTARTIKTIYIGVNNIARKVKKAYIGVNNVARLFFKSGGFEAVQAPNLSAGRYSLGGTSVGNYGLLAGGYNNGTSFNTVDAYDLSLTRSTPTTLSTKRSSPSHAVQIGDYGLLAGGSSSNVVDAYNASLTRSVPTALSAKGYGICGAKTGNYVVMGGFADSYNKITEAYNTSLTKTTPTQLSLVRGEFSATTVNDYALLLGGRTSSGQTNVVDTYNASLTRGTITALSASRYRSGANTINGYGLCAGGYPSTWVVDAYDTSLTRSTLTSLSGGGSTVAAYKMHNCIVFITGNSVIVNIYNESLTRSIGSPLTVKRDSNLGPGQAQIGEKYGLWGGTIKSDGYASVEAYTYIEA